MWTANSARPARGTSAPRSGLSSRGAAPLRDATAQLEGAFVAALHRGDTGLPSRRFSSSDPRHLGAHSRRRGQP